MSTHKPTRRRAQAPSVKGINHVAVAVPSLDSVLPVYRDLFGFQLHCIEEVPDQKVRVAVLVRGTHHIELVEPAQEDSPISKFLEKRGPGLHHLCFEVQGLSAMLDNLKAAGIPLIDQEPRIGANGRRIAFLHPKGTGGVLIELSEAPPKSHGDMPSAPAVSPPLLNPKPESP